mgnify:CR=1 FL=1
MKVFAIIFAFVVAFQSSIMSTKTNEKRTIKVTVLNVTSDSGKVSYALYDKADFMKKPLQVQSSKVKGKKSVVVFVDVDPGEYAVVCFHDANDNDQMDFEANGMPLEDYGVSNNPMSYGPPQYDQAKFEVSDKDVTLEIRF